MPKICIHDAANERSLRIAHLAIAAGLVAAMGAQLMGWAAPATPPRVQIATGVIDHEYQLAREAA
jgi:hypothetical protein